MIKTHTPYFGRMAAGLLGVLLAFAGYRGTLAAEISELTIDAGWISAIAIAPGAKGIAMGVEGASDDIDKQEAEVRWWNWSGKDVKVAPRGNGFTTSGEAIYRGDERGFEELGPRRWTPAPWTAALDALHVIDPELWADGDDCSAILDDAEGRIAVRGARLWEVRIDAAIWRFYKDKGAPYRLAVSRDCTAVALAVDKRLIWAKSP